MAMRTNFLLHLFEAFVDTLYGSWDWDIFNNLFNTNSIKRGASTFYTILAIFVHPNLILHISESGICLLYSLLPQYPLICLS